MTPFRLRILAQTLPFLLITPGLALAQHAPTRNEATAALNQPARPAGQQYTRQQIDQLVAPIALYPDHLLSQVLMASTYPDQVVQAAQWLQDPGNADIKGDAMMQALETLSWDPSVKGLCAFPQVIQMMAEHIEWTGALGVAFAMQQAEVMARVQALRHLAMQSGRIDKLKHLKVRQEGQGIVITEAEPDKIYVPVYDPTVVYGQWPDRELPPVFLAPPQGFVAETIEPGLEVSVAYAVVRPLWGWSEVDWRSDRITVNRTEYTRITRNIEVGPGNTCRHAGPIVLMSPGAVSRTTTATTANVPAGTVAPAKAAAVTALPQRAAADPARIKTQPTTDRSGATQPGTARSGTSQPEQNQTRTNEPNATYPAQGQATPSTPEPSRGSSTEPGKGGSAGSPSATAPEHKESPAAQSGSTEPRKPSASRSVTATGQGAQPGKPEANTVKPGEREAWHPEANRLNREQGEGRPSRAREQERANMPNAPQPQIGAQERAGSSNGPNPAEQPRMQAPERNGAATAPGQHEGRIQAPEQSGNSAPSRQAPTHNPEQSGAKPPDAQTPDAAPPVPHQQRRPGPEAGQGSSTPPAGGQPQAAPQQQRQHEGDANRPQGRDENEKKER